MNTTQGQSEHDAWIKLALSSDTASGAAEMASRAYLSRFHFQRVFRRAVGETPGVMRRRLILERAAFDLRSSEKAIVEIALDAGYLSHEGFSRAFRRAFHLSPRDYRKTAQQLKWLPGTSGVHYDPETKQAVHPPGGRRDMNLTDRLLAKDYAMKRRILECARLLSPGQLDAPLAFQTRVVRFVQPPQTLRETLIHLCGNGEMDGEGGWVEGLQKSLGWEPDTTHYLGGDTTQKFPVGSPAAMIEALEISARTFRDFVRFVERENLWDKEWVDDGCEPPHTFAVGQVIEETLSSSIAQRRTLEIMMEQLGFDLWSIPVAPIE